jgi:hypothetical protein
MITGKSGVCSTKEMRENILRISRGLDGNTVGMYSRW